MSGWIIALIIVAVLFGIGAIFCAPWSPIHKRLNEAKKPTTEARSSNKNDGHVG